VNKQIRSRKSGTVMVTKQQVKDMIVSSKKPVIKYTDTILDFNGLASGNTFINLTMPSVGTGQSARQADTIVIDHFDLRMTENFRDSVTTSADVGFDRVVFFQNIGEDIITSVGDILDDVATSQNAINSPLSYSNKGSTFHPLLDHTFNVDTFNPSDKFKVTLKPSIKKVRFNVIDGLYTTGVPTLLLARNLVAISGGSAWSLEVIVRMWYYDV